jgi:hypothetical protein
LMGPSGLGRRHLRRSLLFLRRQESNFLIVKARA